jgi:hypothetical protein
MSGTGTYKAFRYSGVSEPNKRPAPKLGFGTSERRTIVEGISKERFTEAQEHFFNQSLPEQFKVVVKPVIKKTLNSFLNQQRDLIRKKKYA